MSGSGGGGYVAPQRASFDCDTSIIITDVSSIDIDVLNRNRIRNILNVILNQNDILQLEDNNGEMLGVILHHNTADIIQCIKNGAEYQAEITQINTPSCKVKISRI